MNNYLKINKYKEMGLFLFLCIALIFNHRVGYITLIGVFSLLVFTNVTIKSKIDKSSFFLFLYCFLYLLISSINEFSYIFSTIVLYGIAPLFFYQYGKNVSSKSETESQLVIQLLLIVICYCIDTFWAATNAIVSTGILINPSRVLIIDEGKDLIFGATGIGLSMDIGMVGLPMTFLVKNNKLRIAFLLLFIFSLLTTLHLINRTGLFVAFMCFCCVIGYRYRHNFRALLGISVIILIVTIVLLKSGVISSDLIDIYKDRNTDLSTLGTRTERWQGSLTYLLTKPFGWASSGEIYYIHNMWLDIARISGIIPFGILAWFSIAGFLNSIKLTKLYNNSLSYLLLGLNICFFSSCFVEPIYGGTHFMLYCLLWGVQNGLFYNKKMLFH